MTISLYTVKPSVLLRCSIVVVNLSEGIFDSVDTVLVFDLQMFNTKADHLLLLPVCRWSQGVGLNTWGRWDLASGDFIFILVCFKAWMCVLLRFWCLSMIWLKSLRQQEEAYTRISQKHKLKALPHRWETTASCVHCHVHRYISQPSNNTQLQRFRRSLLIALHNGIDLKYELSATSTNWL